MRQDGAVEVEEGVWACASMTLREMFNFGKLGFHIRYNISQDHTLHLYAAGVRRVYKCTLENLSEVQIFMVLDAFRISGTRYLEKGEWDEVSVKLASEVWETGAP